MNMTQHARIKEVLSHNKFTWLVTGVAGFIGSHLLEYLLSHNQRVIGLDNFATGYKHNIESVKQSISSEQWDKFSFIEGDIRNYDVCWSALDGVEYVLHQAAIGSVPRSIENPIYTHENNLSGFLNMITAAKEKPLKGFVYASSSSVYGSEPHLPKLEDTIGEPLSPYALSKLGNELYAKLFKKCYDFNSIGLRYFNVFGPRQDPNGAYAAVIPRWIDATLKNAQTEIYGDGTTSRDFCYVQNVVQINVLAALTEKEEARNNVYNTALNHKTSLTDLNATIRSIIYEKLPEIHKIEPLYKDFRKGDIKHSQADISKARKLLGYEPTHTIEQGLAETIDWYTNNVEQI